MRSYMEEFLEVLEETEFEERPVELEEFLYGEDYLNLKKTPLSENQLIMVKAITQILKRDTLHALYGPVEGDKRWKQTYNEAIFMLGKGSGKDFCSTIACAYIVYILLCLRDPADYFGLPTGEKIALLNIAINAQQANNVFFSQLTRTIENCAWFEGRYERKAGEFAFDKNVHIYSGHSEREAWEGYNIIFCVLDEIAGFKIESTSGNEQAKTAEAVYKMYRASVDSRFRKYGKLVLLSFPRYRGDFIMQRYEEVVASKDTYERSHVFKLDPDLPDGTENNELTMRWEEDHIQTYKFPGVYALRRPSWEVRPGQEINDYAIAYFNDPIDVLTRFACMPPEAIDAFFKDKEKIERIFAFPNGVDETGRFREEFKPLKNVKYFVHVDLAKKHDHCAVAIGHVEKWVQQKIGGRYSSVSPYVVIDAVRWWTPTSDKSVDFGEVRDYIVSLAQRGFNLSLVTFDRWRSDDLIDYLNSISVKAEVLSVAKQHYQDFAVVVNDERLEGPDIKLLRDELLQLRIMPNDKIDHPRSGSKDLADATCGAIYNAIAHTPRQDFDEVEVLTAADLRRRLQQEASARKPKLPKLDKQLDMPTELANFVDQMRML